MHCPVRRFILVIYYDYVLVMHKLNSPVLLSIVFICLNIFHCLAIDLVRCDAMKNVDYLVELLVRLLFREKWLARLEYQK